tara:strand:+ start:87 stop:356 length:270 start_codon:yes stop_codon:yes gene_type:complete
MRKVVKEILGFTIEHGVPLSDLHKSRNKWVRLVDAMDIGDSTVLKTSGDVVSFRMTCKKQGFKCVSRAIRDEDGNATNDIRVWKLKNEN